MSRSVRIVTSVILLLPLISFSYGFFRLSSMNGFAKIVIIATTLLVPLISLAYVFFRLAAREEQLKNLFKLHGILKAYITSKGLDVSKKSPGEEEKVYWERLEKEFDEIFRTELKSEYGRLQYVWALFIGSFITGLVTYYLATSSFGGVLIGAPDTSPSPLQVALLGAFAWNLWLLLSSYDRLDLVPSTFYWIAFRYVAAITAGVIAPHILKYELAIIFALLATVIPYPRLIESLRSKVPGLKEAHAGEPPIWKIQGMQQATIDRLETLGIYTTQELAYADPLMLLFRTNFQPKVVIDWIDQSLLYNYVGESTTDLRVRGIRGSIELKGAGDTDLLYISRVLQTDKEEVEYLRDKLQNDYQVNLVEKLWDEFKPSPN